MSSNAKIPKRQNWHPDGTSPYWRGFEKESFWQLFWRKKVDILNNVSSFLFEMVFCDLVWIYGRVEFFWKVFAWQSWPAEPWAPIDTAQRRRESDASFKQLENKFANYNSTLFWNLKLIHFKTSLLSWQWFTVQSETRAICVSRGFVANFVNQHGFPRWGGS